MCNLLYLPFQNTPDCDYFTHFADESACFSWDYCVEFSNTTCTDCISGEVTCAGSVTECSLPGLCEGVEIDFSSQLGEDDCANECAGFDGCEWYSYDSATSFCILTPDCSGTTSCPTCVHGEKNCGNGSFGNNFEAKNIHIYAPHFPYLLLQNQSSQNFLYLED